MDQHIQISPATEEIPSGGLGAYVRHLAAVNRIEHKPIPEDALADSFARLSGSGHESDEVEQLLLALSRAGVISRQTRFKLHVAYLNQPG